MITMALAIFGWLISALLASSASAETAPCNQPEPISESLRKAWAQLVNDKDRALPVSVSGVVHRITAFSEGLPTGLPRSDRQSLSIDTIGGLANTANGLTDPVTGIAPSVTEAVLNVLPGGHGTTQPPVPPLRPIGDILRPIAPRIADLVDGLLAPLGKPQNKQPPVDSTTPIDITPILDVPVAAIPVDHAPTAPTTTGHRTQPTGQLSAPRPASGIAQVTAGQGGWSGEEPDTTPLPLPFSPCSPAGGTPIASAGGDNSGSRGQSAIATAQTPLLPRYTELVRPNQGTAPVGHSCGLPITSPD
jgi:hypothetical protein